MIILLIISVSLKESSMLLFFLCQWSSCKVCGFSRWVTSLGLQSPWRREQTSSFSFAVSTDHCSNWLFSRKSLLERKEIEGDKSTIQCRREKQCLKTRTARPTKNYSALRQNIMKWLPFSFGETCPLFPGPFLLLKKKYITENNRIAFTIERRDRMQRIDSRDEGEEMMLFKKHFKKHSWRRPEEVRPEKEYSHYDDYPMRR